MSTAFPPYDICKNAIQDAYISGASSSGSAVAVGAGLVSFSLGTDSASSGRVPAALNGLIELKPSRELISNLKTLDPIRPGMIRKGQEGQRIELEIWALPEEKVGSFLNLIKAPLRHRKH